MTSLFQSEHLSLLAGTGLSIAVEYIAVESAKNAMSVDNLETELDTELGTELSNKIKTSAREIARKNSRGEANIEDYIRIMNELIRGLQILEDNTTDNNDNKSSFDKLDRAFEKIFHVFAESISQTENSIALADDEKRQEAFDYLVNFLMSFASRTGTRERLNIFTTNYDRLIEAGSELAGLHLLDRFVGTLAPIFRSSRLDIDMHYNPPSIRGEPRYLGGLHDLQSYMVL